MDRLLNALLNPPSRICALGGALFQAGGVLVTLGVYGRIAVAVGEATRPGTSTGLSDLYPNLPTFFVPEGWIGFGASAFLMVLGWTCKKIGQNIEKSQR